MIVRMSKVFHDSNQTKVSCTPTGWDVPEAKCDATTGGLSPGAQIALVIAGLALLCVGTFLYAKFISKKDGSGIGLFSE